MSGAVPPQIETPKTFIGVGARELVVLAAGGLLGLTTLFLPIHLIPKVGLAVMAIGLGLAIAFGRDQRSGKTLEAYLTDVIRYHSRKRFRQKGAIEAQPPTTAAQTTPDAATLERWTVGMVGVPASRGRVRVRPLPLGAGLLLSILSFAFLGSLLAWIWLGGLAEIQAWLLGGSF